MGLSLQDDRAETMEVLQRRWDCRLRITILKDEGRQMTQSRFGLWRGGEACGNFSPKQLGEIAEAELIAKAVRLGFVARKPWGIVSLMISL